MSKPAAALLTALALLLAGCAGIKPPRVEDPALYLLDAHPAPAAPRSPLDAILVVEPPRARPGFDTSQIAYVRQPHQLEYYAKNRWVDAPSRMLAPLLAQALALTGGYRAVLLAPTPVPAEFRLDTELIRLLQDFGTQPSRVHLTLRVQLYDLGRKTVLAAREFDEVENAASDDAYGGVIAANRVLERMLTGITDFCLAASAAR